MVVWIPIDVHISGLLYDLIYVGVSYWKHVSYGGFLYSTLHALSLSKPSLL